MVTSKAVIEDAKALAPLCAAGAARVQLENRWSRRLGNATLIKLLFLLADLIAVALSHGLAGWIAVRYFGLSPAVLDPANYALFYLPFFAAIQYLCGGYKSPGLKRPERELEMDFKVVSFFFLALVCANFVFFKPIGFSRYVLVSWYVLGLSLVVLLRFSLRGFYAGLWRRGIAREITVLAGPLRLLEALQQKLLVQRHFRHEVVGALASPQPALVFPETQLPVLGRLEDWETVAERYGVRRIILHVSAVEHGRSGAFLAMARRCREKGIGIEVYSDMLASPEFHYERNEFFGSYSFSSAGGWSRAAQFALKRALDFLLGLVGSLVTLVLLPVIALLQRREDRGPVFYASEFVGTDGRPYYYRKFRTMVSDADAVLRNDPQLKEEFDRKCKLENDPRVLRVGRFLRKYSIDEFPQFFSLLSGKLTFVGPRTVRQQESQRYGELLPRLLSVKPGMTGYWQVMGRQTTSYEERIQMDMFYIEHWSIWLDLVIMGKTVWKVISADGAY
jgi:exopolysaccharide biosynthesis polyprenyl glycosylphosphotransferase